MKLEERQKIYALLARYYPNAKQLKNPAVLTAWGYILERLSYSDVKKAVIAYAARNKFFPDVADITSDLIAEIDRYAPPAQRELEDMECTRRCWERYKEANP